MADCRLDPGLLWGTTEGFLDSSLFTSSALLFVCHRQLETWQWEPSADRLVTRVGLSGAQRGWEKDELLIVVGRFAGIAGLCLNFPNVSGLKCFLLKEHFLYKDELVFANKIKIK